MQIEYSYFEKFIFKKFKNSGEYSYIYYPGIKYQVRTKLGNLYKNLFLEILLISSIITFYILNYERKFKEHDFTNTIKADKKVYNCKEKAIYISTIICGLILVSITLLLFFKVYPHSNFLKNPISTIYNMELDLVLRPIIYITWQNISVFSNIVFTTIFGFIFVALNTKIIISLNYLVKDMLMTTILSYLIIIVLIFLSNEIGVNNPLIFLAVATPIMEILNITKIFTYAGNLATFPYCEIISVLFYYILITIFYTVSKNKYFKD